jgi:hypothetical protein
MLQELESLEKQLRYIGLSTKANDISFLLRSIAGDKDIDEDIEIAINELVCTSSSNKIQDELVDLLMLHGNYTKFLENHSIATVGSKFYIKNVNGSRVTALTVTPEEAVALLLVKQSN